MSNETMNWKELAASGAQSAARTARYFALVAKKRLAIASEQEKIRRMYIRLGKVYYKDYITDEEPDDAEYQPLCEAISECYRRINELREELAEAKEEWQMEDVPAPEAKAEETLLLEE